jgi:hypothetical protein
MVSSADWPRGVDARSSSPRRRASSETGGGSLDNLDDKDEDERTSYVCEKLYGKRPAGKEPSPKIRKTIGLSHREERPMSIGATVQPRRRQMCVSSLSDDDGPAAPPPPRVVMPLPSTPARAEMCKRRRMRETALSVPNSTWATPTVAAWVASDHSSGDSVGGHRSLWDHVGYCGSDRGDAR